MFDELKEVKYFEEITYFKSFKNKTLEETSSKSRGVLKPKRAPVMELSIHIFNGLLFSQQNLHHRFSNWVIYIPSKILKFSK